MRLGECSSSSQYIAFRTGEGDAWYERNKDAVMNPIVIRELTSVKSPDIESIIEVGCGNGRYLNEMYKHYGCHCIGYDPSIAAIHYGRKAYQAIDLRLGSTTTFRGLSTDILVFGFCLYLVDREDLHGVVADADWSVRRGGFIIVHDFDPEYPHAVPYHHRDGLWSYKMDYAKLWLSNPVYRLVSKTITQEGEAISILQKGEWRNGSPAFG